MKLTAFFVKSYRSIVEANLKEIGHNCVIVGPNNSGKSNLLRAIYIALSIALDGDFQRARRNRQYTYAYNGDNYNWSRDIPASLKDNKNASTVFKLTFEFSDDEKKDFKEKVNINLSKSLQIKFELFSDRTEYNIIMPGRAKAPMEKRIQEIGLFIRSKLDYEYIPCVRSAELTDEYFSRILNKELRKIESTEEYKACIEKINAMQKPIICDLENKLSQNLKVFIPQIQKIVIPQNELEINSSFRLSNYRYRRSPIEIDDGNLTSIEDKGDGTKSLIAIALMESVSFEKSSGKSLILCIEEPEAHLHPDAIHSLKNVLVEISNRQDVQVIISTHSPLLIDRERVSNNIVVSNNHRIHNCNTIKEIREELGVRISDTLSATKIVLTEGESDKRYFEALCCQQSRELNDMVDSGELQFVSANSADKMDYQIKMYDSIAISTFAILDSDDSGLHVYSNLIDTKIKLTSEMALIKSAGMKKSELEDIVDLKVYTDLLMTKYNINVNTKEFKKRNKVWSDRLHLAANKSPGNYNDTIEAQIKTDIADLVVSKGLEAIAECDKEYVKNLIECIKNFALKK